MPDSIYTDNEFRRQLFFVDGKCGSGKTYQAGQYIKRHLHEYNFLYVVPTLRLIDQIAGELEKLGIPVKVITQNTEGGKVGKAIEDAIRGAGQSGTVLLVTFQAYSFLPWFHTRKFKSRHRWQVVIDEMPQLDSAEDIDISNHADILAGLRAVPVNDTVSIVTDPQGVIPERLKRKPDDIDEWMAGLYRDIHSTNRLVYVETERWHNMTGERLYFLSLLNPRIFHDGTIFLAASPENYLITQYLKQNGFTFSDFPEISSRLRQVDYSKNEITIFSYQRERWSKYKQNQIVPNERITHIQKLEKLAGEKLTGKQIAYITNKGRDESILLNNTDIHTVKIEPNCHGLNNFMGINHVVADPAFNRSPIHEKMLISLTGFEPEMMKRDTDEKFYQIVMRTGIRDTKNLEPVTIIVGDDFTARSLCDKFGLSEFQDLESHKVTRIQDGLLFEIPFRDSLRIRGNGGLTPYISTHNKSLFFVTKLQHLESSKTVDSLELSWLELCDTLEYYFHENAADTKQAMIAAAFQDSNGPKSYDNFAFTDLMILDCDGWPEMENVPARIDAALWQTGIGRRKKFKTPYFVFPSKSQCAENPNKFKIVIPLVRTRDIQKFKACYEFVLSQFPEDIRQAISSGGNSSNPIQKNRLPLHTDRMTLEPWQSVREKRYTDPRSDRFCVLNPNDFEVPDTSPTLPLDPDKHTADFLADLNREIEALSNAICTNPRKRNGDVWSLMRQVWKRDGTPVRAREGLPMADNEIRKKYHSNVRQWQRNPDCFNT